MNPTDVNLLKVNDPYYVWNNEVDKRLKLFFMGSPDEGKSFYFSDKPMGQKGSYETYNCWSPVSSFEEKLDDKRVLTENFEDKKEQIKERHVHNWVESGQIKLDKDPTFKMYCSTPSCHEKKDCLVISSPEKVNYLCNMNAHFKTLIDKYQGQILQLTQQIATMKYQSKLVKNDTVELKPLSKIKAQFWADACLNYDPEFSREADDYSSGALKHADELLEEFNKRFDPPLMIIKSNDETEGKGGDLPPGEIIMTEPDEK